MKGKELYQQLIDLTGLEDMEVRPLLDKILGKLGITPDELNEENVRIALITYLQEIEKEATLQNFQENHCQDSFALKAAEA